MSPQDIREAGLFARGVSERFCRLFCSRACSARMLKPSCWIRKWHRGRCSDLWNPSSGVRNSCGTAVSRSWLLSMLILTRSAVSTKRARRRAASTRPASNGSRAKFRISRRSHWRFENNRHSGIASRTLIAAARSGKFVTPDATLRHPDHTAGQRLAALGINPDKFNSVPLR